MFELKINGQTKIKTNDYLSFVKKLKEFEQKEEIECEVCGGTGHVERHEWHEDELGEMSFGTGEIVECPVCLGHGTAKPTQIYKKNAGLCSG